MVAIAKSATTKVTIDLPWPHKDLSPNARVHWGKKARAVRAARAEAHFMAIKAHARKQLDGASISVVATFSPPDARRRDRDNMLASIKPYLDGISDQIGIDDSEWPIAISKSEPVKGGLVRIELQVAA